MCVSAPLAVPYATKPRSRSRPIAEEMLTIAPPPASSMCGTAALLSTNAVVTLKWNDRSRNPGLVSRKGRGIVPPALFTTMSIRPNSVIVRATRSSTASLSLTSQGMTTARRPKAAHVGGDLVELVLGARGEHDVGARGRVRARDRGADATPRAGDDRDAMPEW